MIILKLTVIPNSVDNILEYKKIGADAFIFGLKDFCSGYMMALDIEKIKGIVENNPSLEIFIAINKNIFNDELATLEDNLNQLDKINIKGVLFYDLAVLNIKIRNKLKVDLVWNQTHMVTNYNTCNYYYSKGVNYGMLSGEITLEEINEIASKTKMQLFAMVMGYPIMSFSRRMLLSNYFSSFNKKKKKDIYNITNNNNSYILKEEENGNAIYYGKPLNGSIVLDKIRASYLVLNEFNIATTTFKEILSLYKKILIGSENREELIRKTDELIGAYRGFFFQKTIYKVKKND